MCGILGVISIKSVKKYKEKFENGLEIMRHRGYDHNTYKMSDNYIMGYTRLAIQGNESCNQPILLDNGFAFGNGENYEQITPNKNDLYDIAVECQKFNEDVYKNYDAEFAVSVFDEQKNTFYLTRDRFGLKPLFYSWLDKDTFVYSSEVKSLLPFIDKVEQNPDAIMDYLLMGYPTSNKTIFKNIYSFPQKSTFKWDLTNNKKDIVTYNFNVKKYSEKSEDLLNCFVRSLKNRTIGTRVIATHLSGGLDSTLVNYGLKKYAQDLEFEAYTAYLDESDDDLKIAKTISKDLKNGQNIVKIKENKNYEKLTRILDSPIMSTGAFVPYYIAKQAEKNKIKILIAGQGSDEIFLGYSRFKNLPNEFNYDKFVDILINSNPKLMKILFKNFNMKNNSSDEKYSLINLQQFYVNNFMHELLKIEDHVNMNFEIENRTPFLSKEMERFAEESVYYGEEHKKQICELHNLFNTKVPLERKKSNLNSPLKREIQNNLKYAENFINEKPIIGFNYGEFNKILNNLDTLEKSDLYLIWFTINYQIWREVFGIKEQVELNWENWGVKSERVFKFE